jgi:hypothetical protein
MVDESKPMGNGNPQDSGTVFTRSGPGLVAVGVGVIAIMVIGVVAVALLAFKGNRGTEIVSVATSAFGVIGSIVGAFFGIKLGTEQTQSANVATQAAEAKADVYAAHVPEGKTVEANQQAEKAATAATDRAIAVNK